MTTPKKVRWMIVTTWERCNSVSQTAKMTEVSKKVASKWISRYRTTGDVVDKAKTGRPGAMSTEAKKRAYHLLLAGEHPGALGVARQLQREKLTPTIVSGSTVIRGARKYGKEIGKPIRCLRGKPAKRLTHDTKAKRLAFAHENKRTNWSRVMFTDRKKFNFSYPGAKVKPVEWVVEGRHREASAVNHPLTFNLYAGITKSGVTSIHQVSGTSRSKTSYRNKKGEVAENITSEEYIDVVRQTFLPGGKRLFSTQGLGTWVLQQDNDPTHKVAASLINDWNKEHSSSIGLMPNWPPNSPDLNPIENLWGLVSSKVDAMGCKSFEDFKQAVRRELSSVSKKVLENLVDSMPKRLGAVIELEGDKTKY